MVSAANRGRRLVDATLYAPIVGGCDVDSSPPYAGASSRCSSAEMRCLSDGMRSPTTARDTIPIIDMSPMAKVGLTALASPPTRRVPRGLAPIARLMTPNTRPRISSLANSMTMVACMVAKHARTQSED